MIRRQLLTAFLVFFILTIITGIAYPLLITVIAQRFFYKQANGSIIYRDNRAVGSLLIGQAFEDPKYLWGRPSATLPMPFNSASSSGSNLGPSNPAFKAILENRIKALKAVDPHNKRPIPIDLITSSASGLDPHISLASAYYQIPRIAKKRTIPESVLKDIINKNTNRRLLRLIGEPVVNVLKVNLDLDSYKE